MIYQFSKDLEVNLQDRKYPVDVRYGEDYFTPAAHESYSVHIKRDDEAGDGVDTIIGSQYNPKRWGARNLGVIATFYVTSPLSGSTRADHEHDCDALVDAFLVEVLAWVKASKAGMVTFAESRYLRPEEFDGSEHFQGVAYRLRFEVPRGLIEKDYDGVARPTAAPTKVTSKAFARVDGGTHEEI